MSTADEMLHVDAVLLAQDVLFWRATARSQRVPDALRRRSLRHARAAETRLVDLAIRLETQLQRRQGVGDRRETSPVPNFSVASTP